MSLFIYLVIISLDFAVKSLTKDFIKLFRSEIYAANKNHAASDEIKR